MGHVEFFQIGLKRNHCPVFSFFAFGYGRIGFVSHIACENLHKRVNLSQQEKQVTVPLSIEHKVYTDKPIIETNLVQVVKDVD